MFVCSRCGIQRPDTLGELEDRDGIICRLCAQRWRTPARRFRRLIHAQEEAQEQEEPRGQEAEGTAEAG